MRCIFLICLLGIHVRPTIHQISNLLSLKFNIQICSRAPPACTEALLDELLLLIMGELILWVIEFLRHLVIFPKYYEEEHLKGMRVSEHRGHMVCIFSGFLVLFIQIRMFSPVSSRILMVNDVVIFMQYVDWAVEDCDRADEFVLRIVGTKECMPAPVHTSKEQHILAHREENVPEGEYWAQETHKARERKEVQGPCDHLQSNLEVSFLVELDGSGNVGGIAKPSRQVAQEVTEIIPRFVRCRYHIIRAIVVFVVVDTVPVRE
mmetsp:Transcript_873/g.1234  ORF Transcript_873/g.1234 Transcript_873/m.1234 type:complete len:263 (-) Transcript_873:602-1390(-)